MAERNENEDLNQMKNSAEKRRQNSRKNKIQRILMQRRNLFAKSNGEQMDQNHKPQEVKEDIVLEYKEEEPRVIKGSDLTKHYQKKEKVLDMPIPHHLKNRCPHIRCFWCHKFGHVKANCHMKMIEYVYHRVKEDVARKEMKMEQNQMNREKKKEQKQYEKKILQLGVKELNSKYEKKRGKEKYKSCNGKGI